MPKLEAGEWFLYRDAPAVLLSARIDQDGEVKIARQRFNGIWYNHWLTPDELNAFPRLDQPRWNVIPHAKRSDEHHFYAVFSPNGRKVVISAGCMTFDKLADARKHWRNRERPFNEPAEAKKLNAWSLRYVDKVAAAMKAVR